MTKSTPQSDCFAVRSADQEQFRTRKAKTIKPPKVVYDGGLTDREHAIIQAHRWQLAHAAENTPTPSEAYQVIADLLRLLPYAELQAAIAKATP